MARRLKRAAAAAVVAAAVALAGCGVPTESHPSRIDRQDVPFGLVKRGKPAPTTTSTIGG